MYKAKQRMKTLLLACFAALVSMLLAVALWVTPTGKISASAATVSDTLNRTTTGATTTSYITWSDKTGNSGAVYAGNSAGGNSAIQLRSNNNNSGIVTTVSGGKVAKITVEWQTNTTSGRTLDVYGKNSAYSQATDLYNASTQGTKLGSITYGTSTELNISGNYTYIGLRSNNGAMYLTSITIEWGASCSHANTDTVTNDATCTVAGSKVVTCKDCGETVSTEVINATGHDFAEPTYERNGDKHTATGTCNTCGETTEETEDCTLSYVNVSNENGTHNMTSTCSVCEKSVTTENVGCTFGEGVLDGTTLTYTCEYCEYSYTEEATMHTVTYVVPNNDDVFVQVADGYTTVLPKANDYDKYTFVGWATEELAEKTEDIPEYLPADTEYTVTEDIELYALYSYAEGTGAWTLVTDVATLAVEKEIVIVASGSNYALGTTQNSNNRGQAEINKDDNTVSFESDTQIISLESGTVDGTFAFKVSDGYLYAASSSKNYLRTQTTNNANGFWLITVDSEGIATIKAQGSNTNNWLRYNSSSKIFSCYASGQTDVSIYMKDGATYYVTEFNTCAHTNTNEVIEEATCTESGSRTVTCLDCASEIEAEILPALGHNYIDGICDNCGEQDPTSIVYDGYYYLILNSKYLDSTTLDKNDRYKPVDFTPDENIEIKYVFYFIKNGETYNMYDFSNGLYMENVTLTTNNNYTVNIYNAEGNILSHNTTANYVGFYKTTNNYPKDFTFTQVDLSATIDGASITIDEDITMNYKVTMSDVFAEAIMYFTVEEKTYKVSGEKVGERYVFSLEIPPHLMASNISAKLKLGEQILATQENYSVKAYAQNMLNNSPSDKLKQLLTDLLYYGDAAYNYANETTDKTPVTNDVENIGTASTAAPATTDFKLENMLEENATYPAYFLGAGVYFDNVNKIYVKLSTTENVTLTINGVAVEVTGDTVYTDGILATGFAETYTFVLSCNGEEMQTLTYSVNAYVYAMKDKGNAMAALAIALYNYGESAKAYKA